MSWSPFFRGFLRALFILYCIEAGVFLTLIPWKDAWQQLVIAVPWVSLQPLLLDPFVRSAITGFGLVHLVWGAHDVEDLLVRRKLRGHQHDTP